MYIAYKCGVCVCIVYIYVPLMTMGVYRVDISIAMAEVIISEEVSYACSLQNVKYICLVYIYS